MWAGRENGGANQRERAALRIRTSVFPRLVSGAFANTEDALVVGAKDYSPYDRNRNNSGTFQE